MKVLLQLWWCESWGLDSVHSFALQAVAVRLLKSRQKAGFPQGGCGSGWNCPHADERRRRRGRRGWNYGAAGRRRLSFGFAGTCPLVYPQFLWAAIGEDRL